MVVYSFFNVVLSPEILFLVVFSIIGYTSVSQANLIMPKLILFKPCVAVLFLPTLIKLCSNYSVVFMLRHWWGRCFGLDDLASRPVPSTTQSEPTREPPVKVEKEVKSDPAGGVSEVASQEAPLGGTKSPLSDSHSDSVPFGGRATFIKFIDSSQLTEGGRFQAEDEPGGFKEEVKGAKKEGCLTPSKMKGVPGLFTAESIKSLYYAMVAYTKDS